MSAKIQQLAAVDRIIHEPARLMVVALLAAADSAEFKAFAPQIDGAVLVEDTLAGTHLWISGRKLAALPADEATVGYCRTMAGDHPLVNPTG